MSSFNTTFGSTTSDMTADILLSSFNQYFTDKYLACVNCLYFDIFMALLMLFAFVVMCIRLSFELVDIVFAFINNIDHIKRQPFIKQFVIIFIILQVFIFLLISTIAYFFLFSSSFYSLLSLFAYW